MDRYRLKGLEQQVRGRPHFNLQQPGRGAGDTERVVDDPIIGREQGVAGVRDDHLLFELVSQASETVEAVVRVEIAGKRRGVAKEPAARATDRLRDQLAQAVRRRRPACEIAGFKAAIHDELRRGRLLGRQSKRDHRRATHRSYCRPLHRRNPLAGGPKPEGRAIRTTFQSRAIVIAKSLTTQTWWKITQPANQNKPEEKFLRSQVGAPFWRSSSGTNR